MVDKFGNVRGKSLGEATVTLTTAYGLTDSILIKVVDSEEIKAGEKVSLSTLDSARYFKFVPEEDGTYTFTSDSGQFLMETGLYDSNLNIIRYKTDNSIAIVSAKLTAGVVYYLKTDAFVDDIYTSYYFSVTAVTDKERTEPTESSEYDEIEEGIEKKITPLDSKRETTFIFKPSVTGIYNYFATGEKKSDIYGAIYDSNFKKVVDGTVSSDSFEVYSYYGFFNLECRLEAGETYYIKSQPNFNQLNNYSVIINRFGKAESIEINGWDGIGVKIGTDSQFKTKFMPENTRDEILGWESDNTEILTVDNNGNVHAKALGEATITVKTASGLTDTLLIKVEDHPEIKLNEKKIEWTSLEPKYYRFIPEKTGKYIFNVPDKVSTVIYDSAFNKLLSSSERGEAGLILELTAGETYYIRNEYYQGCVMVDYTFYISSEDEQPNKYDTLEEGVENSITSDGFHKIYTFSPAEIGMYHFYATSGECVGGIIYDSEWNELVSGNKVLDFGTYFYRGQFDLSCKLEAGKTYYLEACSGFQVEKYSLIIKKYAAAESIEIKGFDGVEVKIGTDRQLEAKYMPDNSSDEIVSWESDNTDILTIDNNGNVHAKALGEATITVKTATGLTDTLLIKVADHEEIKLNEKKVKWTSSNSDYYRFIPEKTGKYTLISGCERFSIQSTLYDVNFNKLDSMSGSGENSLIYEMTAGEVYYIKIESNSGDNYVDYMFAVYSEDYNRINDPSSKDEKITSKEVADINNDGVINSEDALLMLKSSIMLTPFVPSYNDLTGDGFINAEDALIILKYSAMLVDELPDMVDKYVIGEDKYSSDKLAPFISLFEGVEKAGTENVEYVLPGTILSGITNGDKTTDIYLKSFSIADYDNDEEVDLILEASDKSGDQGLGKMYVFSYKNGKLCVGAGAPMLRGYGSRGRLLMMKDFVSYSSITRRYLVDDGVIDKLNSVYLKGAE